MNDRLAAYVDAAGKPLRVGEAPDYPVGTGEVKIRNRAFAVNPADLYQIDGLIPLPTMPWIPGADLAGEVVQVGANVKNWKVGQRVAALCPGFFLQHGPDKTSFQHYTVLPECLLFEVPKSWSFTDATVLPAAATTAASALFHKDHLNLSYPTVPTAKPNNKILLIWSGASSVGITALQMAVQAGYECITTSGSKHFDYLKSLGAVHTFDYSQDNVIQDIVSVIKEREKDYVGAFSAQADPTKPLQAALVAGELKIGNSPVATSNPRFIQEGIPSNVRAFGVFCTQIFPDFPSPGFENDPVVHERVMKEWLPAAMKAGTVKPAPEVVVVGKGLDHTQAAIDRFRKGVSGQKLVVEL